ncbi:MAG: sugar phosphate isomerase/epimerase family protein [Bryobacterales bacterium]|nr:sugar phosphate isomerase/epimerase [Bryobacteraceae bacterium]MDW8353890.1 sugar phosphate isomerase/epimerase family protein [Bryobacterales bacterium]
MSRRELLLGSLAAARLAAPATPRPSLCLFSKHLPELAWKDLGRVVRDIGFDGVDLTVRPKGHVLPERAAQELPQAVEQIRAAGVEVPMITTALTSAADPTARVILATAGRLGIPYFKPGYWLYRETDDIETRLGEVRRAAAELAALGREYGIVMGFHNHSGSFVGHSLWEVREILANCDPRWAGYYFDVCHAVAEGGAAGWRIALRLALPRLKMVAVKDFYWEKRDGRWQMRMCPLGEGMVEWTDFFATLAAARFAGPISLHLEYHPADERAAIAHDFEFLRRRVREAYGL